MAYETIALIDIVEDNYNQLVETHRNLDKEIKDMYNKHSNEEDIKLQKVKKLHLKDEIALIKDRLANLVKK
jgi:uncharacterized protein YdcH (DUF465 family)|tara:strand:+ start:185 stop:397 length:213 start_codon:yes stop_codon:yes gene_type:complete